MNWASYCIIATLVIALIAGYINEYSNKQPKAFFSAVVSVVIMGTLYYFAGVFG